MIILYSHNHRLDLLATCHRNLNNMPGILSSMLDSTRNLKKWEVNGNIFPENVLESLCLNTRHLKDLEELQQRGNQVS